MKVIILGFDALDNEIVENERLEALLQKFHGCIDVSGFKVATPMIWSTFLTGKNPEEHQMYFFTTTGNRVIEWFRRLSFEKNVKYSTIRSIGNFFKPILNIIGIKPRVPDKRDLKPDTIFDLVENALPINVMMFNEWKESEELKFKYSIIKAVGNPELTEKVVEGWKTIYFKQKKEFLNLLSKDWDIIMTHVYMTDIVGHLYYNQYDKFVELYRELNDFTKKVTEIVKDSAMIMVVSDHGMKRGIHQPRAFYSFNKEPPFLPEKMTDYYKIINQVVLT